MKETKGDRLCLTFFIKIYNVIKFIHFNKQKKVDVDIDPTYFQYKDEYDY